MSSPGPFGNDDDPFAGMSFLFADLARMLQQQGPVSWDAARQLAASIATAGASEPNIDPLDRIKVEELARVAELHVAQLTGLTIATGQVTTVAVNRTQWVHRTIDAYRPVIERIAASLSNVIEQGLDDDEDDPFSDGPPSPDNPMAMFTGMMQMIGPMMLGMTAGSLVGHLAGRSFGQYDLPIPRPEGEPLMLLLGNLDEFGSEWSLPTDDLRLWVCISEMAHQAVLHHAPVRRRIEDLLGRYADSFEADPSALEDSLGDVDLSDPGSLAQFQELLTDPDMMLGAIQSSAQRDLLPQLDAVVMAIEGYVDWVLDSVAGRLLSSPTQVAEALRRRRVERDPGSRLVERLFGLEMTQDKFDRGSAFVAGVLERTAPEALTSLWAHDDGLPTPAEIEAPGLWLARLGLDDGDGALPPLDEPLDVPDYPDFPAT